MSTEIEGTFQLADASLYTKTWTVSINNNP